MFAFGRRSRQNNVNVNVAGGREQQQNVAKVAIASSIMDGDAKTRALRTVSRAINILRGRKKDPHLGVDFHNHFEG